MGPTAIDSTSGHSLRLDRTVHCSTPRLTPAYASSTPRFGYLPMPNASWKAPSLGAAIAQTFSVHDRSDWATVAKVWVIWWVKVSSAGTSGPKSLTAAELRADGGPAADRHDLWAGSPQSIDRAEGISSRSI